MTTMTNNEQLGKPRTTRVGLTKAAVERLMRHPATDVIVMVLILFSIGLLFIEEFSWLDNSALNLARMAEKIIIGIFIVELSTRWYLAPTTKQHFREYWLDWLAVFPTLRPMRTLRILRMLRLLRLLRLYRFGVFAQRFVAGTKYYRFEEMLRNDIAHYRGRLAEQVWLVPDLFRMLTNLLEDGRVDMDSRKLVTTTLAYFITPFELLPDELYGPEGYLDQIYLSLWTIKELREEIPEHVLQEAWEGEGEILEIVEQDLSTLGKELEQEGLQQIGRYLGLGAKLGMQVEDSLSARQ